MEVVLPTLNHELHAVDVLIFRLYEHHTPTEVLFLVDFLPSSILLVLSCARFILLAVL